MSHKDGGSAPRARPAPGSVGMQGRKVGAQHLPTARPASPVGPLLLRCLCSGPDRPFQG